MEKKGFVRSIILLFLLWMMAGCSVHDVEKFNQAMDQLNAELEAANGVAALGQVPQQGQAVIVVKEAVISANVRTSPSMQAPIVTTIPGRTSLVMVGADETGDWALLDMGNGQQGWMQSDMIMIAQQ